MIGGSEEVPLRALFQDLRYAVRQLRFILTSAAKLGAIGYAIGVLGALAHSRLLRSFPFGVKGSDPAVLSLSVAALLLLALVASAIPASRAASVNPVEALRSE